MDRLGNISSTALHDFVDITVFLILGAVLAALAKQQIGADRIDALSQRAAVPRDPGDDAPGGPDVPVQRGGRVRGGELHEHARLGEARVPGARADARPEAAPDVHARVPAAADRDHRHVCVVVQVLVLCLIVHLVYQANGWTGLPGKA